MADETEEHNGSNGKPEAAEFDPELTIHEVLPGPHSGDQYLRVQHPYSHLFRRVAPGVLRATEEALEPRSRGHRFVRDLKGVVIGRPLPTEREVQERLTKVKALAVFASDAISSCAYATEEVLLALVLAGTAALANSVTISLLIAILLSVVAFSYRQTVMAYPNGGGSYIVARENIGRSAGLVAAAALMLDYILTVAVSISAGVDAITSAFSSLAPFTVPLVLFFIALITIGNLRGIRESGSIFSIPTYAFIFGLVATLGLGLFRYATGMGPAEPVAHAEIVAAQPMSLWLLLTAFSAGSVAMSGTEAISNGVPAFKEPESRNAALTLTTMATLLGVFFLGISFLASQFGLVPNDHETVISQLVSAVFGKNVIYYYMQFATMGILIIAANTSFADFPRLASILARDDFMPHAFRNRGDRLAFSTGIIALAAIAGGLVIAFQGNTHLLIPLYAVGVFLAFTLSQAGMVLHWRRLREPGWLRLSLINGVGAVATAVVLLVAAVTKFQHGAWIILVAIPVIVTMFLAISRHYQYVDAALDLSPAKTETAPTARLITLVVIPTVNFATRRAIRFARSISDSVTAIHVAFDKQKAAQVQAQLRRYDPDIQLVTLEDPYRTFAPPLVRYIRAIHESDPEAFVTIVLPEFVVRHWWERLLHNRDAQRLQAAFHFQPNVAIVNVPYLIE